MSNLLSGLGKFGLGDFEEKDLFEEEKKVGEVEKVKKEVTEEDFIFDKTYTCPVCDKEFKTKAVRSGKSKLLGTDFDLRAKYQGVDSLKYDAILCPHCGYAALSRYFNVITSPQAKLIREKICANYKPQDKEVTAYTYDEALEIHKLALVNCIVKKCRASEKAYLCLKIAWLLRGKKEELPKDTLDYKTITASLEAEETDFMKNSFDGFVNAVSKEDFPMCGMDEQTIDYLIAALSYKTKHYDLASKLLSKIITSRTARSTLKDKARGLKELLVKEVNHKK